MNLTPGNPLGSVVTGNEIQIDTPEQGDLIYYNGTVYKALAHGTSGQVLQTGGHAANPSWLTLSTGTACTLIGTTRLAAAAADITFSSIATGFKQFVIIGHVQTATSGQEIRVQLNGDTGNNYTYFYWYPSASSSGVGDAAMRIAVNNTAMGAVHATISNSTSDSKYMIAHAMNNALPGICGGSWDSNNEITAIKVFSSSGNLAAGSYLTLLGFS
jgi:hypothetical protein